jgi:hypothetical protein
MNIQGRYITDDEGRILLLRGYKPEAGAPCPASGGTGSRDRETISLPGRLFPLDKADACFERLRSRGLTFILMPLPWNALEQEGPGIYDEAYLAYLRKILLSAEKRGISVFIRPFLGDRETGGQGIPAWIFEKIGLDIKGPDPSNPYAEAAFFTLFFAGNSFAPEFRIEGVMAQDWLQERYFAAMRHCFRRLKNCAALAGWSAMGTPCRGFIGGNGPAWKGAAGAVPSPFQTMAAASGHTVDIPVYASGPGGRYIAGYQTLNPRGLSLFKPGFSCPWKKAGVWTDEGGTPQLIREDYFDLFRDKPVCFADDFLKPFLLRFIGQMREAREKMIILIEGVPGEYPPAWSAGDPAGVIWTCRYSGKFMENIPCLVELPSPYSGGMDENLFHGIIETGEPELSPGNMPWPWPCPTATAGIPLKIRRDREGGIFTYRFRAAAEINASTEIYIPPAQPGGDDGVSIRIREPDTESCAGTIRAWYDREQGKGFIANRGYRGDIEIAITYSERKNSSTRL